MFTVLLLGLFASLAAGLPVSPSTARRSENPLTHGDVGHKLVLSICIIVASLLVLSIVFFVVRKLRRDEPQDDTDRELHPVAKMQRNNDSSRPCGLQPIGETVGDVSYYHTKVWQERNNGQRKNPSVQQPVLPTAPAPAAFPLREREDEPLPGVQVVESWEDSDEESPPSGAALRRTPALRGNRKRRLSSRPGATHWVRRKH